MKHTINTHVLKNLLAVTFTLSASLPYAAEPTAQLAELTQTAEPIVVFPSAPAVEAEVSTGTACDRSCLYGITDQYFAALEAHDPGKAAAIRLVKFTENGVRMALGDGLWNTFSGRRGYNLRAADIARGQVAVIDVVEEHGVPAILAARFRIANRQIVEIETVLSRNIDDSPFPATEGLTAPSPVWSMPIEEAQRQSRDRMVTVVDGYYNSLQQNNGSLSTKFADDCNRIENGLQVTNNPNLPDYDIAQFGCARQLELGQYIYDDKVRNRRYPVVDPEMGIVVAAGFLDRSGKVMDFQRTDGTPQKSPFFSPQSVIYLELFRIENNAIRHMEAVSANMPYNMPSVW